MKQFLFSTLLLIFSFSLFAQLSGSYTIGGTGANYSTVVEAVDSLNSKGVSGAVVFNIKQGTYTGRVEILNPTGVSAANNVTFRPDTFNTAPVILTYSALSSLKSGTFILNNVDYVNVDSLTIQSGGVTYGHSIEFIGGASNIKIDGCKLEGAQFSSSTSNNTAIIYDGTGAANMSNNITIQNCSMKYGGYAMYVYGSSSANQQTGWVVKNNDITEFNYYGTYFYYTNVSFVDNNLSNRTSGGTSYPYCASYFRYCYNTEFRRNTILFDAPVYGYYGVYFQYCYATNASRKYFSNNIINMPKCYYTALYSYNANYVDFKYNTIKTGSGRNPSYGAARIDNGALSVVENNIFYNETGGLGCQYSGTQTRNYNNYFTTGSPSNVALGANSLTENPLFVSATDLHVQNVKLNGKANSDTAIKVDFEGDARTTSHDIGADEFTPPNLDLSLASLSDLYCTGNSNVLLGLSNFGLDTITSAKISWSIAANNNTPVGQSPFYYTGSFLSGADTSIVLGAYSFSADTTYQIWAHLDSVNGIVDVNQLNDSIQTDTFRTAMSGTYYVGGSNPDFNTPSDALSALTNNGICGSVIIKLRSGTYNGQVQVGNIAGVSAINTVLITRDTGSTQPIITSTTSSPTIRFSDAKYITVKDISILSQTFNGQAIQLINDNSYLNFDSCFVKVDTTSRSSSCAPFYKYSGLSKYVSIDNSELVGGYYSVYSYGSSSSYDSTMSVTNSKMTKFYEYGVMVYYHEKFDLTNNTINNMDRTGIINTRGGGSYMYYSKNLNFQSNVIVHNGTYNPYGIYLSNCSGNNISNRSKVINNMISLPKNNYYSGTGNVYANYLSGANYTEFKFNSLYIGSGSQTYFGCFLSGTGLEAFNNNIVAMGDNYVIYKSGSFNENYNNLYSKGGGSIFPIGTNLGANDLSIDPGFYSSTDLHATSIFLNGKGVTVAGVTKDIDGDTRNASTPDIGADEFNPVANDLTPLGITSPLENTCGQDSVDLFVLVQNNGLNTHTTQPMTAIVVSPVPATLTSSGSKTIASGAVDTVYLGKINTSFGGNFVFKLISSLSNDQKTENDTLDIFNFKVFQTPAVPYVGSGIVACSDIDTMLIASTSAKEVRWFDSLGAAPIFIGDSFPINLNTQDTFWVMGSNDYSDNLGVTDRSLLNGINNTGITQGLKFNVERELVIDTVTVYPNDSGLVVVRLLNSTGILLRDTSFSVNTSGVAHLPINFRVYPGDGYTLDATGTVTSGLWRSYSPRYPYYDTDSAMSITGPKSGSTYYYDFFYNWKISVEGCESDYRIVPVGVRPSLNVNIGVDTGYCVGNTFSHTFNATNSGASSFKWQNNSIQSTFNVTTQGTYWVDVASPNGCITRDSVVVSEVALPIVVFNGAFYCDNQGAIQVAGSPMGGTVTGSGAVNGLYYPGIVGPGNYSVTYYYEDSIGCGSNDTGIITVGAAPIVTVVPPATICQSSTGEPLTGGMPTGGYYYGNNVQANKLFSPSPGIDTINYVYYALSGCHDTATATIQVLASPNIVWGALGTVCTNTPSMTLNATPSGGTYTGSGVTGNTFDPTSAGAGSGSITYVVTGSNGCSSTKDQSFVVYPTPFVSMSALPAVCADNPNYSLSLFGFPNTGVFTGAYVDGVAKTFDVVSAGAGSHPVNYVVTNQYGCKDSATESVLVKPLPQVDFGGDKEICGSQTVELDAENPGASYVWNTGETSRYITVGTSGKFIVTITENGCQGTDSVSITYSETCVGIDPNFTDGASISIYPNPASEVLNIDINGIDNELMTFSIMTLSGQNVLTFDPQLIDQSFDQSIDLSGLSVGVYLLKVSSKKGNSIYRVSISE